MLAVLLVLLVLLVLRNSKVLLVLRNSEVQEVLDVLVLVVRLPLHPLNRPIRHHRPAPRCQISR